MIPAEAVDAAERAAGCAFGNPVSAKEMEGITKILEAAAPHMLAGALESAATTFSACSPEGEYSSTPQQVIDWLREQAAMHRPTP